MFHLTWQMILKIINPRNLIVQTKDLEIIMMWLALVLNQLTKIRKKDSRSKSEKQMNYKIRRISNNKKENWMMTAQTLKKKK